jgi:hypothetical protein
MPIYFEGEILKVNPFGILKVNIFAPKDLNVPILQTNIKTASVLLYH